MAVSTKVRFSNGVANAEDVTPHAKFSWEHPVPDNDFWRSFNYPSARNFLQCFTTEEAGNLHLNERFGSISNEEKARALITILENKLSEDESKTNGLPMWETDHETWEKRTLAIGGLYYETGQIDVMISITNQLIEHRVDKSNLSHFHNLAWLLAQRGAPGDYAKAEELESKSIMWLDEKLGKDSPQSLGARRTRMKAVWMQGRLEEAERLIAEIWANIDLMGQGKFAMYVNEEKREMVRLTEELKKARSGDQPE